ncbi:TonB-dependent outer membrane receptor, SusC/RagA subfamily, signature region [Maribacter sedimenticola]|uniref:TonB-dependent outer membrane receptor, SusC/RagA subfamily, signature region n=1 Tax=Maribacter sedimenticola TaxID=228956 RepID=A0ABY1SJR3_9FLAO|nr:TonB-dependent receptor plug domain-containing protein [Maribacter sedimenticola]SNR65727.1 TonB-dependent outer membrane receptor, SusC/RagA subfamily, signature region [Maribacter sedimenticola]
MKKNLKYYKLFFTFFLCIQISYTQNSFKEVTICWDQSSSMITRNLQLDFEYLDEYFTNNPNMKVKLLLFGIDIQEQHLQVSNGNWGQLKDVLSSITYDGASIFSNLNDKINDDKEVLVFTDGNRLFKKDFLFLPDNSILINSNIYHNLKNLQRTALRNNSSFVNFANSSDAKGISKESSFKSKDSKNNLKGIVYIDTKPSPNLSVGLKGSLQSVITAADGSFNINAQVGDSLVVTNSSGKILKIVPVEFIKYTKILLESSLIALDEVTVVEEKESIEYVSNGYNTYNKDGIGYKIETIESDEIAAVETSAGDVVRNKISGVNVATQNSSGVEGGLAQTEIRGRHSINMDSNAMIVVDGIPINRSSVNDVINVNFIDPGNIEKVSVLKGLAATNIWGSAGANGVILITTKTGNTSSSSKMITEDKALLKNNVYDINSEFIDQESSYTKAFRASKSLSDAYDAYKTLKNADSANNMLYLDAFSFFKEKDVNLALVILSNLWENNPENVEVLKLLSLAFTSIDYYDLAAILNDEIINIVPKDVNAHLSQALVFKEQGKPKLTYKKLDVMLNGNSSIYSNGISKTLNREIKNLVFTNKSDLVGLSIDSKHLNSLKYKVRMVFEWNFPGAEFELQFVNPKNRYYNWKHTNEENKDRLINEINNEFRLEEFEFNGDEANGKWIVNAVSLQDLKSNKGLPLVLKATIYRDYGYPEQKKEQVFVYFTNYNEKKNLLNINVD